MKKNINILLLSTILFFTSCDLDSKLYSSYSDANFPKTEEDINAMVTSIYAYFKSNSMGVNDVNINGASNWPIFTFSYRGGWIGMSETAADVIRTGTGTEYRFTWGLGNDTWDPYRMYNHVRNVQRATQILGEIEKISDIPESRKSQLIAEVKCLRAWVMFHMYDFFGPVPVIVDPAKLDNIVYEPRPTKEWYFNQMVTDLTEAMPYLYNKTNGTSNWGRVNKGLASMLLMKLYMNDHQFDKALPYAENLTKMGYSLSSSYHTVFTEEHNDENIWSVPSGATAGTEFFFYNIPSDCAEIVGISVQPYWGMNVMRWDFYDTYSEGDKRLEGIADHYTGPDGTVYSRHVNPSSRLSYGAIPVKYLIPIDKSSTGNFALVVYRYADVILSLAEIECELNGPTEKALNYLKQITNRVGTTHTIPANIQSSKEAFKEFLLAERGRELYYEGWRRQDLIRFDKFIEVGRKQGYPAADYMKLFPIPSRVRTESKGVVEQNPGYEE